MRNAFLSICAIGLVSGMSVDSASAEEVPIVISPNVINIDSQGVWVTVHAEIDYWMVKDASVTLDNIPVVITFADSRGELVAKFAVDGVKDSLVDESGAIKNPNPILTLWIVTEENDVFTGSDEITVIDVSGNRK